MSNFAPAVDWAVKIVEIIAGSDDPLGITDISRLVGINKNMVFRVLNSLEAAGWVYCDNPSEKKYTLTMRPFQMTQKAAARLSINTTATPFVHALWKRLGESTYLGILRDDKVLYIQHFDSTRDVKVAGTLGGMYDLYCSAPGKVLLAFADDEYIDAYLQKPLVRRTAHTITEPEALRRELASVRQNGYAMDREEFGNGILCVAAPVYGSDGKVLGTVGCSVSTITATVDRLMEICGGDVIRTAAEISRCCGYMG